MWGNSFLPGRFMFVYHRKPTPQRKTTVIHQTEIKNKKERSWSGENCLMIMSWKKGWWSEKSQEGITKKLWRVYFPPQKVRTRQVTCSENDRTRLILRGGSFRRSDRYIFNIHQTRPLKNQHIQNLLLKKKINLSLQSITYVPKNGTGSIGWQGRVKDVMAMAMVIQNLKLYFICRAHDICNTYHQHPTVHERQDTYIFIFQVLHSASSQKPRSHY